MSEQGRRAESGYREVGKKKVEIGNIQSEAEGGIETSVGNMSEGRKCVGRSGMCRNLTEGTTVGLLTEDHLCSDQHKGLFISPA